MAELLPKKKVTDKQREFLERLSEALPYDLKDDTEDMSNPIFNRMPTLTEMVQATGVGGPASLRRYIGAVEDRWALPDSYIQGDFEEVQARARRLIRQYRIRRQPDGTLNEEDKTFLMLGPLGTASRLTNPDAFKGLAIVNEAYGFKDSLKGVLIGGDVVPEIGAYWTIRLQDQQILMGKMPDSVKHILEQKHKELHENGNGNGDEGGELPQGRFNLDELIEDERLEQHDVDFIRDEVAGTINSLEAALETAAHQIAPTVKSLNPDADIIIQWSVSDYFNIRERIKYFIDQQKKIESMELQAEKIPEVEESIIKQRRIYAQHKLSYDVGKYVMETLDDVSRTVTLGEGEDSETVPVKELTGMDFRNYVKESILGNQATGFDNKLEEWQERFYKARSISKDADEEEFEDALNIALLRYTRDQIRGFDTVNDRATVSKGSRNAANDKLQALKTKLEGLENLAARIETEKRQSMAHITKQYALEASDSKVMNLVVKKQYSDAYEVFLGRLEELVDRPLRAHILKRTKAVVELGLPEGLPGNMAEFTATSDESDSIEYALDGDSEMAKKVDEAENIMLDKVKAKSLGTKVAMITAPNFQRSNEPIYGDLAALQAIHDEAVARQVAKGRSVSEFEGMADADIFFTAYGAGGWEGQPKMRLAETTIPGEYRETPEVVSYIKGSTMHDVEKLSKAQAHGNRSWNVKRFTKGGMAPGALFHIIGADGGHHGRFFGTGGLAKLGAEFYDEYETLTRARDKAKSKSEKTEATERLEEFFDKVKIYTKTTLDLGDGHYGASHTKGRPTQHEAVKSSAMAMVDSMGIPDATIHSEMLHGKMMIRSWGYDCTIEAAMKANGLDMPKLLAPMYQELKEGNLSATQFLFLQHLFGNELAAADFIEPRRQLDMLKKAWIPFTQEIMSKGGRAAYLSGNHWNTSCYSDEAHNIVQMYDEKWLDLGLLHYVEGGYGNSQTVGEIYLPGTKQKAMVFHKMWHGRVEVDRMGQQAVKIRNGGRYKLTDDRHQPGYVVHAGHFGLLSPGNQPWNPYVPQIGKTGSLRGSSYFLYDDDPEKEFFGWGFYLDDATDSIIGWNEQAKNLAYVDTLQRRYAHKLATGAQQRQIVREKNLLTLVESGATELESGNFVIPPGGRLVEPVEAPGVVVPHVLMPNGEMYSSEE